MLGSGNRKSAAFADVTAPIEAFEAEESERLSDSIASALQRRRILDERLKHAESHAAKAGEDQPEAFEDADRVRRERDLVIVPVTPRLVVDDCTPEKLASLLVEQGGRIAQLSPEGDVFDIMAGRYSSNGAANFGVYLKGHAGDPLRVDRQGRSSEFIASPALTLGLAIQPDVLQGLMARPGFRGRGLLARFLYSIPRSTLGRRIAEAPPVPNAVAAAYASNVRALLHLPLGTDAMGASAPHILTLTPEARVIVTAFERALEPKLGEFGELAHIADWAAKLVGAIGRIAGLLHAGDLAEDGAPWETPISDGCIERAIRIGEYLVEHALAAFGKMGSDPDLENARYLLGRLQGTGRTSFTKRDAFEATKQRFKRVAKMMPALTLLEEHRYVRLKPEPPRDGPGRKPSPTYEVNPASQYSHNSHNRRDVVRSEDCAIPAAGNSDSASAYLSEDKDSGAAVGMEGNNPTATKIAEVDRGAADLVRDPRTDDGACATPDDGLQERQGESVNLETASGPDEPSPVAGDTDQTDDQWCAVQHAAPAPRRAPKRTRSIRRPNGRRLRIEGVGFPQGDLFHGEEEQGR